MTLTEADIKRYHQSGLYPPGWSAWDFRVAICELAMKSFAVPEAARTTKQIAWCAYTETGKEHLIWHTKGDEEWLAKHYARWTPLYGEPLPQPHEQPISTKEKS